MKTLLALTIVTITSALIAVAVHAGGGASIRVTDYTARLGDDITIVVEAVDVPPPGLGAWAIDVVFDPSIVDAIDCQSEQAGECSPAFAPDTVRVTGAVLDQGITGTFPLVSFTFECFAPGTSDLEVDEVLFTTAEPQVEISDLTIVSGSITCTAPGQNGVIRIGDHETLVGSETTVVLEADGIPEPGLGVWTVDITYNNDLLDLVQCDPKLGGSCDTYWAENTLRVTGANASGMSGTFALAEIVFKCQTSGTSPLAIQWHVLTVAVIGLDIVTPLVEDGSFECGEEIVERTTPRPVHLPSTGAAPPHSSPPVLALLALAGVLLLGAASALGTLSFRAQRGI